jgi:hypothetical protein
LGPLTGYSFIGKSPALLFFFGGRGVFKNQNKTKPNQNLKKLEEKGEVRRKRRLKSKEGKKEWRGADRGDGDTVETLETERSVSRVWDTGKSGDCLHGSFFFQFFAVVWLYGCAVLGLRPVWTVSRCGSLQEITLLTCERWRRLRIL